MKVDYKFQQEDIGKRVLLILDPEKLDEENLDCEEEHYNIPYKSIRDYEFLSKVKDTKTKPIINIGPKKEKINPVGLCRRLGVDRIGTIGDIVEVAEDYLKIKRVKISYKN